MLDALNRTVFQQQQTIDRLQEEVRALRQQLRESLPGDPGRTADEIPPHY